MLYVAFSAFLIFDIQRCLGEAELFCGLKILGLVPGVIVFSFNDTVVANDTSWLPLAIIAVLINILIIYVLWRGVGFVIKKILGK